MLPIGRIWEGGKSGPWAAFGMPVPQQYQGFSWIVTGPKERSLSALRKPRRHASSAEDFTTLPPWPQVTVFIGLSEVGSEAPKKNILSQARQGPNSGLYVEHQQYQA